MTPERFNEMLDESFQKIFSVLGSKAEEYAAEGDRLHNFIQGGKFKGETPAQALWGFETKHLISLTDMVMSGDYFPLEKWDEKIFDAINYLLLLRAVIIEEIPPPSAGRNVFADAVDAFTSHAEKEHFDGDGCCGSTEPDVSGFEPMQFPVDEFASTIAKAFAEAFGPKPVIMHINNYITPKE